MCTDLVHKVCRKVVMTMFENTINALRTLINVDAAIICTGSEDSIIPLELYGLPFFLFTALCIFLSPNFMQPRTLGHFVKAMYWIRDSLKV